MKEALVVCENLSKSFSNNKVLKGISFELHAGQITSILGVNGAGKSTLLKILAGFETKTSGSFQVPSSVAMVHQELSLFDHLSVAENLFFSDLPRFKRFQKLDWKKLYQATHDYLNLFRLNLNPKSRVGWLSVAEKQMLEVAKALHTKPQLLILDEPTSSLSRDEVIRFFEMIREVKKQNASAIVFVSHKLTEVKEISDQVLVLRDGELKKTFLASEILCPTFQDELVFEMTGHTLQTSSRTQTVFRSSTSPIFSLHGFKTCLKEKTLLQSLGPIHFNRGDHVGIVGLVGSGRSVFLKTLYHALKKSSGYAGDLYYEMQLDRMPSCFYVHEDRKKAGLFPNLSPLENISLSAKQKKGVFELKRAFSIRTTSDEAFTEQEAQLLSGGNQQKLILSRALLSKPEVLLLDEPTRGVDLKSRNDIHQTLKKHFDGVVFFSSSDFEEILEHASRILYIKHGQLFEQDLFPTTTDEIFSILLRHTKGALV